MADAIQEQWIGFWTSLYHALAMLWTFWALVLGFSISAALQVFVSRKRMTRAFGETSLQSVAVATGLGAARSERGALLESVCQRSVASAPSSR